MQKRVLCVLVLLLCLATLSACKEETQTVTFSGVIEEVRENSLLVRATEGASFDMASVGYASDMEPPTFNYIVGQTVRVTILPEVAETYPVQVTAVRIELAGS